MPLPVYRIVAGEDGRSRLAEEPPGALPSASAPLPASAVYFREFPAGTFLDWHPAPRRQVVVVLSGTLECETGDGRVYRFGPGDARIIEDVSGPGHTTRVLGDAPAMVAVVALTPER
jgi:quercetin dioxygenase-like cupin family protein